MAKLKVSVYNSDRFELVEKKSYKIAKLKADIAAREQAESDANAILAQITVKLNKFQEESVSLKSQLAELSK